MTISSHFPMVVHILQACLNWGYFRSGMGRTAHVGGGGWSKRVTLYLTFVLLFLLASLLLLVRHLLLLASLLLLVRHLLLVASLLLLVRHLLLLAWHLLLLEI